MNSECWQQATELYDQMIDLSDAERRQRIQEINKSNHELARLLNQMIDADEDKTFMSLKPAVNISERNLDGEKSKFGHFQLLDKVAVGGMGRIYKAKQATADVPVYVALKLIRKELVSQQMTQRFEAEKQILSRLKHHHIAALIDAGVVDETPYIATEWVEGQSISDYCQQNQLGIQQILNLFLQVCEAVGCAHNQLIIHRDLKPANIIVDHNGQVKLLDFGIAKMLDADQSNLTQTQVFTPEYAAPEQVNGEFCSTTTDIYALGVLLFELLTNQKRFGLSEMSMAGQVNAITDPKVIFASDVMKQNQIPASSKVKGAIDTIINQAMHLVPQRRYQSVYELINDIKRYQQYLPIKAMGDGWLYQGQMMIKRHAWTSLFAFLLFVSLSTGLLYTNQQKAQAIKAQELAQSESIKSQQMLGFFMTLLESASPISGGSTQISVKEMFKQGSEKFDLEAINDEATRAEIAGQIAEIYGELSEYDLKISFNNKALAYYSQDLERHASKFLFHHINIAKTYQLQDLNDEALEYLSQAYEKVKQLPLDASVHAEAMINFGQFYLELNQPEKALVYFQKAEDLANQVSDAESLGKVKYYQYLILQHELPEQASERYLQQAQDYFEQAYPKGHPDLLAVRNSLAIKYKGQGHYIKASKMYEVIHTEHMQLYGFKNFNHLTNHADTLFYLGQFSQAFEWVSASLKLIDSQGVEEGFSSMAATVIQARCLIELKRFDEAAKGFQQASDFFQTLYAADHVVTMVLRSYKLDLLIKSGQQSTNPEEEVELMQLAEKQLNESNSSRRRYVNTALITAISYWKKGQYQQALDHLEKAKPELEIVSQKQGWSYWLIQAGLQKLRQELGLKSDILKLDAAKHELFMLLPENHWYHGLFTT